MPRRARTGCALRCHRPILEALEVRQLLTGLVWGPATTSPSLAASQVGTWPASGQGGSSSDSSPGASQQSDDDSGPGYPQTGTANSDGSETYPPGNATGSPSQPAATGGTATANASGSDYAAAFNLAFASSQNSYLASPWYLVPGGGQPLAQTLASTASALPAVGICTGYTNDRAEPLSSAETLVLPTSQRDAAPRSTGVRPEAVFVSALLPGHVSGNQSRAETDDGAVPGRESPGEAEQDDDSAPRANRLESSSSDSQALLDSIDWMPRVTDALIGTLPSPLQAIEDRVDSFFGSLAQLGDEVNPHGCSTLGEWLLLTAIAGGAFECTRRLLFKGGSTCPLSQPGRPFKRTFDFDPRFDDE